MSKKTLVKLTVLKCQNIITSKHLNKCSASLLIIEMQMETAPNVHLFPVRMVFIKSRKVSDYKWESGERQIKYTAGQNRNYSIILEISAGSSKCTQTRSNPPSILGFYWELLISIVTEILHTSMIAALATTTKNQNTRLSRWVGRKNVIILEEKMYLFRKLAYFL